MIFWIPPGHGYLFILCLPPGQQRHGRGGRRGRSGRAAAGAAQVAAIAEALRSDLTKGGGAGSAGHGTRHSKDSTHTELWQRKVYQNVASCSQAQDFPCDAFSKHKASIWDQIGRAVRADRCGKLMEKVRINWIEESYVVSPATRVSERFHRRFVLPTLWFQWIWPTKVI